MVQLRNAGGAVFAPTTIKTIKALWAERGAAAAGDASLARTLSIGKVPSPPQCHCSGSFHFISLQLIDFQWKLGVALQSSACRSLNHSFVGVQLRTADSAGNESTHTFELSIAEFKARRCNHTRSENDLTIAELCPAAAGYCSCAGGLVVPAVVAVIVCNCDDIFNGQMNYCILAPIFLFARMDTRRDAAESLHVLVPATLSPSHEDASSAGEESVDPDAAVLCHVCTACGSDITHAADMHEHPVLHVAVCRDCSEEIVAHEAGLSSTARQHTGDHQQSSSSPKLLQDDDDDVDDAGDWHHDSCTWCGDGGDLLMCDDCPRTFCVSCISRNLGFRQHDSIRDSHHWTCLACDASPLASLQSAFKRAVRELELDAAGMDGNILHVARELDEAAKQTLVDRLVLVETELEEAADKLESEALERISRDIRSELEAAPGGSLIPEDVLDQQVGEEMQLYTDLWKATFAALSDAAARLRDQCDAAEIDTGRFYHIWEPKAREIATTKTLLNTPRLSALTNAEV